MGGVPGDRVSTAGIRGWSAAVLTGAAIAAGLVAGAATARADASSPDTSGPAGSESKAPRIEGSTAHAGTSGSQHRRGASAGIPGSRWVAPTRSGPSAARPAAAGGRTRIADSPPPALILNGYAVEPATPLNVTSFYGKYATAPSTAGSVQGRQQFNLVEQRTGETVGKFGALVAQNNSFGIFGHRRIHTELLVTDVEEGTVGTRPGEVPPPSSRIGGGVVRNSGFGSMYSAMPTSGRAVVRWNIRTPFGNIPLPPFYDATRGFADNSEVNEPFSPADGYSIGPANPGGPWLTTAIAGTSPYYTVEQGTQEFRVYDTATGATTGTFTGYATPTRDALIFHTMAVLVTGTGSTDVGSDPGQVPPPGTVFNVFYVANLRPYLVYSSMPSGSGDVISIRLVTQKGSVRLPFTFNASTPPAQMPLQAPGGYRFVPTSPLRRTGLNGLPPLEVLFQGYQQFDVLDPAGTKIGSVDADVSYQWNGGDPRSIPSVQNTGILVTKVTAGVPGTGPGDVPPAGSVFNFQQSKIPGFVRSYSALPSPTANLITYLLVTPFGSFRIPTRYDAAAGLDDVTYVDPFAP